MNKNILRTIVAVAALVLLTGASVRAEEPAQVRQASGEIGWIDIQKGELELNKETSEGTKTTAYRITQNETRVTDTSDEKFLDIGDLRAGQFITLDVIRGHAEDIVQKITVEPSQVSEYQLAYGELKSIDVPAGTFVVEERVRIGKEETSRLSSFVFDPNDFTAMRSPSREPVELALNTGDVVKVEYVALDGKQQARYITSYTPIKTTITTTTTTTTTQ